MVARYKIWLVVIAAFIIPQSVASWTIPEYIEYITKIGWR